MAVVFALGAALFIGMADLSAATASKRGPVLAAVLWNYLFAFCCNVALAAIVGGDPGVDDLGIGVLAGAAGAGALLCLHTGYSRAGIGPVAPITAVVSVIIPLVIGVGIDGRPTALAAAGMAVGLVAIALISWPAQGASLSRDALVFGIGAGVCFGVMGTLLGLTSDEAALWPVAAARLSSAIALISLATATRQPRRVPRRSYRALALSGLFAAVGIGFFVESAQRDLAVAGLLVQLAYAISVLGGTVLFGERSTTTQRWGFTLAAASVGAISLG